MKCNGLAYNANGKIGECPAEAIVIIVYEGEFLFTEFPACERCWQNFLELKPKIVGLRLLTETRVEPVEKKS